MALTELQLPDKSAFYQRIQNSATEFNNLMNRWRDLAEILAEVESTDLDAMGVAAGQVRTDLTDFRVVLNEMVSLYDGDAVTPTKNPSTIIDKVRSI